jgi:hypothetical protein
MVIIAFFLVVYVITWILHGLIAFFRIPFKGAGSSPAQILYMFGLAGPLVASFLLAYVSYGQAGVSNLLSGVLKWNVDLIWYFLAIAPVGIIYFLSAASYRLWKKEQSPLIKRPERSLFLLISGQVWVVIAEEIGWRGFALPHLKMIFGWLGAGLVLGILWASWHLPMFFVSGSNQHGSSFFRYMFVLTIWSLFMAMLYYQTNGSVLLCMIFHAAANVWASITNVPKGAEWFELLLYMPVLSIAVTMLPL